jgi:hypothetical protein
MLSGVLLLPQQFFHALESAERGSGACPVGHGDCAFVQDFACSVTVPRHSSRIAGKTSWSYGSRVPKEQYFCTAIENECESMFES